MADFLTTHHVRIDVGFAIRHPDPPHAGRRPSQAGPGVRPDLRLPSPFAPCLRGLPRLPTWRPHIILLGTSPQHVHRLTRAVCLWGVVPAYPQDRLQKEALEPCAAGADGPSAGDGLCPRPGQLRRVFHAERHPRPLHRLPHDSPMPGLKIRGGRVLVFAKIVGRFDGIRAATQRGNTPSRMAAHRLSDLPNACNPSDIGQLRPCKLFFRPLLWCLGYTNWPCLTPHLLLVKLLYFTMFQGEFWVMTSPKCGDKPFVYAHKSLF